MITCMKLTLTRTLEWDKHGATGYNAKRDSSSAARRTRIVRKKKPGRSALNDRVCWVDLMSDLKVRPPKEKVQTL
jgi:hypothetical protein